MRSTIEKFGAHLAILVFVIMGTWLTRAQTRPEIQAMGVVKGTVMDSNGAVIVTPKPSIIFQSKDGVKEAIVNENGVYEIHLAPGIYKIHCEAAGFRPFRRAEFRVLRNSSVMINVVLKPNYLVRGTSVSVTRAVDMAAAPLKYDDFRVPNAPTKPLIQFEMKRTANGNFEYEQAVFSYDALTIYADRLCVDRLRLRLKASGVQVVVEDGKQRRLVTSAEVTFKGGEAVVSPTR